MKGSKKIYKLLIILSCIATFLFIIYSAYMYGQGVGTLKLFNYMDEICNVLNNTKEEGRCVIADVRLTNATGYKHYFHCTWGDYIMYTNYEEKYVNLDPRLWFVQCKRTKVEFLQ